MSSEVETFRKVTTSCATG